MARWRRDQNEHRKISAELGVRWCTQQLEMLQSKPCNEELIRRNLFALRVLECELSAATEELSTAHHEVSVIRAFLRKKRLPIQIRRHNDPATAATNLDAWQTSSDVDSLMSEIDSGNEE